jgi:hypothetical protein
MNVTDMHRFVHECLTDPALGVTIAIALVVALAMAWFVLMDKFKKRQQRLRRGRRRREAKDKAAEGAPSETTAD